MNLSVVVCTHNPREDYLSRALDSLKDQMISLQDWELLLIDNASEPPLEGQIDLSWHPNARIILEKQLGLTAARLRGIKESSGDVLVFVDDDNVLDSGYLSKVIFLMKENPTLGCIGAGCITPEFEEAPASELEPYIDMLALRHIDTARWSNDPNDSCVPWGAGLVTRKEVARAYAPAAEGSKLRMHLGRKGSELNSCEDNDFSWTACAMGLGKGVFPELKVLHLIDRKRVQREYLLRIAEGHAFSQSMLEWIHLGKKPHLAPPPRGRKVITAFLAGRVSAFLIEAHRWWSYQKRGKTELEFEMARHQGCERALVQMHDFRQE
jgi:glycosyltransferase involved in cell wall biosynthesis